MVLTMTTETTTKRAPREWRVYRGREQVSEHEVDARPARRNGDYFVRGLYSEFAATQHRPSDRLLFYFSAESEWPEPSRPSTPARMLAALYDLYQTCDELVDGDTFKTPHGRYICRGVHVVPA
jgi:hypothetical protein